MFSGIVTAVGRIESSRPHGDGVRLRIASPGFDLADVAPGDSISIQGVCHTVVGKSEGAFEVDSSRATLDVTAGLESGREVNLEKSMRLADRIGGHLVSGHVDGIGIVKVLEELGGSARLAVEAPAELARLLARKGSVAVDGVSLTINAVQGSSFEVNVIPHTRAATTFRNLRPGSRVNIEVDMLARYVERMLENGKMAVLPESNP
jgi:riboflavin synthase